MHYTSLNRVSEYRTTPLPASGQTASSYGRKIPTRYMIRYGARWHRVYSMVYGNSGTAYILVGGEMLILDSDTESRLFA